MFATRIVPSALAVRLRAVCPFDTRQTVDKSTMGRYQDASFAGHSTASQLPEPIFPLNLIKIILPLRMMIQLESWYRVTESHSWLIGGNCLTSMTGVPAVMPLIGIRAIGIHTVPELFRILPDGTVGSAAVPLVAVPFSTASAIVSMLFESRVYFTQIRSLRFRPRREVWQDCAD